LGKGEQQKAAENQKRALELYANLKNQLKENIKDACYSTLGRKILNAEEKKQAAYERGIELAIEQLIDEPGISSGVQGCESEGSVQAMLRAMK
jgi:hypothetical protein